MSLSPQLLVKTTAGCASFYVKDITPVYNATIAPNGYNSPNLAAASVTNLDIQITNMATPTVTRTVIIPTLATTFDPTRLPPTSTGVMQYNITNYQTLSSTTLTVSSGTITSTTTITYTTSAAHGLSVGQVVTVSGMSPSDFNVTGIVTGVPTATQFTFTSSGLTNNSSTSGGTAKVYTNTSFSSLTDGVYKIVYNVTGPVSGVSTVHTTTCYVVVDCAISDTLTSMLKDLNCCNNCSDANNHKLNLLYQAYLLREKACYLASCQDFQGAQDILDCLTAMLGSVSCDSCS